ncbi:TTC31 protein, partial [Podilymbus podiceps]|nr:TTC31 protein [Podilymbus podiceps]
RELLAEEERMKKKAEKKKMKKKKQKDRKKREKLGQELKSKQEAERGGRDRGAGGEGCWRGVCAAEGRALPARPSPTCLSQEELDLSCTFIFKARQKAGVRLPAPGREKPAGTDDAEPGKRVPQKAPAPRPVPLDTSVVEQSLILAGRGNEAAQKGRYAEAVQAFTEAVKLNPREYRLFGNRSYCYEKLRRYEEALGDAQVSLGLQPGWLKGFFRKGKALRGLERYAEAASTFEELLRLDGTNAEAAAQLEACRALLRVTHPCPSPGQRASGGRQDTDTSGFVTAMSCGSQAKGQGWAAAGGQRALPPTHPARDCYPLWVGNITARISEEVLHRAFSRFGAIRFIRMLPERRCAFINYARKAAAEKAYAAM